MEALVERGSVAVAILVRHFLQWAWLPWEGLMAAVTDAQ